MGRKGIYDTPGESSRRDVAAILRGEPGFRQTKNRSVGSYQPHCFGLGEIAAASWYRTSYAEFSKESCDSATPTCNPNAGCSVTAARIAKPGIRFHERRIPIDPKSQREDSG